MNVVGAVKLKSLPEASCITTINEFLKSLEQYLTVEFDVAEITNVYVSTAAPENQDRDTLWFRKDNSGNFVGIFVFVQSEWRQMFPPPNQVIRIYGDSENIEPGFELITSSTPGFTAAMANHLISQWLPKTSGTGYLIFDVVYVGL